ncbi:hypothetical protein [Desulfoscipio geothermicus]|uniref:hypothetical protein n=1 Tax=Desulfoscipio geothermicus TaxID=39060 RepID=UPI000B88FDDB|nr:hypothetical protein [Desulfoscipio geothermicus]
MLSILLGWSKPSEGWNQHSANPKAKGKVKERNTQRKGKMMGNAGKPNANMVKNGIPKRGQASVKGGQVKKGTGTFFKKRKRSQSPFAVSVPLLLFL